MATVLSFQENIDRQSFREAIERIGEVGLLELDCKGAEWELFKDPDIWKSVNRLEMKYHLWAKPGSDVVELHETLASLGFRQIYIQIHDLTCGAVSASRIQSRPPENRAVGRVA